MRYFFLAALVSAQLFTPAYAFNAKDCSIWLCLPFGFPSGCGQAKDAFKDRIKKFKPPLPSLTSCLLKSDASLPSTGEISSRDGVAAYIPAHQICTKYSYPHGKDGYRKCVEHQNVPASAVKGEACFINHKENLHSPRRCSKTIRYVDTFMDGKPYGNTYYFDNRGNAIAIP